MSTTEMHVVTDAAKERGRENLLYLVTGIDSLYIDST